MTTMKTFKIAPTFFGSQGIHHQGALYSAWLKTITVILAKHCIQLPDDGSLEIQNMLEQF